MVRFTLAVMGLGALIALSNNNFSVPPELDGKMWLVGLLPAVYLLGVGLLKE